MKLERKCELKRKLLDVVSKVCGYTKGKTSILKRGGGIKM